MFSPSDEYENALISERRAQGLYGRQRHHWPMLMFAGFALLVAGTVLIFN